METGEDRYFARLHILCLYEPGDVVLKVTDTSHTCHKRGMCIELWRLTSVKREHHKVAGVMTSDGMIEFVKEVL